MPRCDKVSPYTDRLWYAYQVELPIDFGWEHLPTVAAYSSVEDDFNDILDEFLFAKTLARELGWDGVNYGESRVFLLPQSDMMAYGFVWKQDHSGTTFVISPYELPWLNF
jgi:hypothetical protein